MARRVSEHIPQANTTPLGKTTQRVSPSPIAHVQHDPPHSHGVGYVMNHCYCPVWWKAVTRHGEAGVRLATAKERMPSSATHTVLPSCAVWTSLTSASPPQEAPPQLPAGQPSWSPHVATTQSAAVTEVEEAQKGRAAVFRCCCRVHVETMMMVMVMMMMMPVPTWPTA